MERERLTLEELSEGERIAAAATPGPWGWQLNRRAKQLWLAEKGGKGRTVMDFVRYGTAMAAPRFREPRDLVMERADVFAAEIPGQEHNAAFYATINHPDANLIAWAGSNLQKLLAVARRSVAPFYLEAIRGCARHSYRVLCGGLQCETCGHQVALREPFEIVAKLEPR